MDKEIKKPKVLIICPIATDMNIKIFPAMWITTLMSIKADGDLDFEFGFSAIPSCSPAIGRNQGILAGLASEENYTHFFFLDSDTYPLNNKIISKMLKLDKDVVSGMYPLYFRNDKHVWSVQYQTPLGREWVQLTDLPEEPFVASGCGGGFMLVSREAIEKVKRPWFDFEMDENGKVKAGEDIYFCRKLIEEGYEIWVEPKAVCGHIKTVDLLKEWGIA